MVVSEGIDSVHHIFRHCDSFISYSSMRRRAAFAKTVHEAFRDPRITITSFETTTS